MTLFNGEADKMPPPEPEKVEKPAEVLTSRIFNDKDLWAEAMEFATMLSYCRPDGSRSEKKFISRYIVPLGVNFDRYGNAYKQVGDNPTVLWSAHTDTVHTTQGTQKIVYWPSKKTGDIYLEVGQVKGKAKSSCLGADDTCGIWLMIQMIKANVPGLYIFHRAEEVGGKGSKWISEKNKEALTGIKFAIAFDRRAEKSIITYQRSKRCCSDEFAKSLADQLGMGHACDTGGSFTDTASYTDLIAECTNVSVGYENAHMASEHTNVDYLFRLRDALLKLDISKLVEKRKPGESPALYQYNDHKTYYGQAYGDWEGWAATDYQIEQAKKRGGLTGFEAREKHKTGDWLDHYDYDNYYGLWFPKKRKTDLGVTKTYKGNKPSYQETVKMIRENAGVIADLLEMCGYDGIGLKEHLLEVGTTGNVICM